MASDNIFSRAKAYVKAHPRTTFQEAIQKVKGKKIAGVKTKAKAPARVAGTRKRVQAKPQLIARTAAMHKGGSIGALKQSQAIINNIDKMERERAKMKSKELKDISALLINAEHKKLKNIAAKIRKGL